VLPLAGRSGDDEGIAVFGRPEGVHSQAGCGRHAGGGYLPQGPLEDENGKLRKVVADLSLDKEMLQDALRRKL